MPRLTPPPASIPRGSTVWTYLRDSGGPRQDRSVQQQRGEILEYCQAYGLVLIHDPFEDIHKSGGTDVGRDAFDEMVALSATPAMRPAGLLVWNFARFARDVTDAEFFKGLLRKRGIVIHSLTDNIPDSPFAPVLETIIHVADEQKRHEAAMGAWRGLRHVVRQGAMPGRPPRGFHCEPIKVTSELGVERTASRWAPDPDVAPMVRLAFEMRASGASLSEINRVTRLYKNPNCYARFWKNRIYIGILEYGDLVINDYCEPIVAMANWNAVQALAKEREEKKDTTHHPRRHRSSYLLSGLAHCADCGSPLAGNTRVKNANNRHKSYRCTRATNKRECHAGPIPATILEQSVIDTVKDHILRPDVLAASQEIQSAGELLQEEHDQARKAAVRKELAKTGKQISRLLAAIEESGHSRSILDQLSDRERTKADLQRELTSLETHRESGRQLSPAELAELSAALVRALKRSPINVTRDVLRGFIQRIDVKKVGRSIEGMIYYYLPPPFLVPPKGGQAKSMSLPLISAGAPLYRHTFQQGDESISLPHFSVGAPLYRHTFQQAIIPSGITWQHKKRTR